MHDRVRRAVEHGLAHGAGVEQVEPDRFGAELLQQLRAGRGVVRADHLVTGVDELRNETAAESAACSGNEDAHWVSSHLVSFCGPRGDTSDVEYVTDTRAVVIGDTRAAWSHRPELTGLSCDAW